MSPRDTSTDPNTAAVEMRAKIEHISRGELRWVTSYRTDDDGWTDTVDELELVVHNLDDPEKLERHRAKAQRVLERDGVDASQAFAAKAALTVISTFKGDADAETRYAELEGILEAMRVKREAHGCSPYRPLPEPLPRPQRRLVATATLSRAPRPRAHTSARQRRRGAVARRGSGATADDPEPDPDPDEDDDVAPRAAPMGGFSDGRGAPPERPTVARLQSLRAKLLAAERDALLQEVLEETEELLLQALAERRRREAGS